MRRRIFNNRNVYYEEKIKETKELPVKTSLCGYGHDEIVLNKKDVEILIDTIQINPIEVQNILENWYVRFYEPLHKCEDCGQKKEDVEKIICPYHKEISDEENEIYLCEKCYNERLLDI